MAPEPEDDIMSEKNPRPLDEDDIALLKTYVRAARPPRIPYPLSNLGCGSAIWSQAGPRIGLGFGLLLSGEIAAPLLRICWGLAC
jgi:hypothetical protein